VKTLKLNQKTASFFLDGVDIGDYLEVEILERLGELRSVAVSFEPFNLPVIGYRLKILFSCDVDSEEEVVFETSSVATQFLMRGCHLSVKHRMSVYQREWVGRAVSHVTMNGRAIPPTLV